MTRQDRFCSPGRPCRHQAFIRPAQRHVCIITPRLHLSIGSAPETSELLHSLDLPTQYRVYRLPVAYVTLRQAMHDRHKETVDHKPKLPLPVTLHVNIHSVAYCCALACLNRISSNAACVSLSALWTPSTWAWLPCMFSRLRCSCSSTGASSASGAASSAVSNGGVDLRHMSSGPSRRTTVFSDSSRRGWIY
jgi:hypothetical protein